MNISKLFSQGTVFPQPKTSTPSISNGYHRNTLEDFLSGHRKNSYGIEGMRITEKSKRIVKVSNEMKQLIFNRVKDSFYKYNGMSGDEAELDNFISKKNEYLKSLKTSERSAASWTMQQLGTGLARTVSQAIKSKFPTWTEGKPISHEVLDEIFSDESIFNSYMNTSNSSNKPFDTFI